MQKVTWLGWYLVLEGFWGRWWRTRVLNSQIQNGGLKCKKSLDWDDTWYSGILEIGDYESELIIQKFKMADPIWRTEMKKVTWLTWYLALGDFGVADDESELEIQKFKMADPIWRIKMQKLLE